MPYMINWNIVTRPNTNVEFFEFTEEDRAYFQNFIDSGKMYSTEETLSQDGLSKIFKMIWYINNSQEAINMQNILGAEQYLQDLAIRSTLYNIENGIQRSTTFYETRDDDGNVLFSGDLTTDALFGNSN